jgi:subtilisin-like proprotein convertase family protein
MKVQSSYPTGMSSFLSVARRKDDMPVGYDDWTFMSVAHWYVFPFQPHHMRWHVILPAGNTQVADDSSRAAQFNAEITAAGVVDIHTRRGDLSVELRSPAGIVSYLSVARRKDDMPVGEYSLTSASFTMIDQSPTGDSPLRIG